jgi:type II secretory pathway pseudopilin PulG
MAKYSNQQGQTLIETLVAAFILIMGVSAAVGLAVYVLNASSNISKQIVASGIARQGIETIKNMRDTNWLKIGSLDTNCYDFNNGLLDSGCFKGWLDNGGTWNNVGNDRGYRINPGNGNSLNYALVSPDSDSLNKTWDWGNALNTNTKYGISFDTNVAASGFKGFYSTPSGGSVTSGSGFYQKIILTADITTPPYNSSGVNTTLGPLFKIQSQVWWDDKHCPSATDFASAAPACRLELVDYLTNWKDYR